MNRSDAAMWWGGHAAALASQRSGLGVFAPVEFHLRRFHLGLDDAISALIEARGGYQRVPEDAGRPAAVAVVDAVQDVHQPRPIDDERQEPIIAPGAALGLLRRPHHPEINNKDLDDSRRVPVPGPPRGGRVFNPSKGKEDSITQRHNDG